MDTAYFSCSSLVPPPTVTINNGTIAIGSAVTLTCTVELDPVVDVPVTVTTVWTGPAGFMTTTTAQPVMGSTTTYTSIAMVNSFGRDKFGNYECTATVSSTSSFITGSMASASISVIITGKTSCLNCMHIEILFQICSTMQEFTSH